MGIQSSLNQLVLSGLGAVAGVTKGVAGGFKVPQAPKSELSDITSETKNEGNIAKIGRDRSRTGMRSYAAAVKAVESGNDMISQKARARFLSLPDRLALVKEASNLSMLPEKKED